MSKQTSLQAALDARRHVDRVADGGIVEMRLRPHVADAGEPGMDADADADGLPSPNPKASSALRLVSVSRMASAAWTALLGVVADIDGRVPEGHDRVADELVERAFFAMTCRLSASRSLFRNSTRSVGRQPLADLGEVAHVDEHHGQLAIVAAEAQGVGRMLDAVQQRRGKVVPEGAPDFRRSRSMTRKRNAVAAKCVIEPLTIGASGSKRSPAVEEGEPGGGKRQAP